MKTSIKHIAVITIIAFTTLSFTTINNGKKEIKTDNSKIVWKGHKITTSHEGVISIKSGHLDFTNDKLIGGEFVIDMTTITNTDLEGSSKGKIEGHLKSDDFFGVEKFSTASLIFNKVKLISKNTYNVTGAITIKGKTRTIMFDVLVAKNNAKAELKIDRTKFGVKYSSASFFENLKDKAIYDEFDLIVDLAF